MPLPGVLRPLVDDLVSQGAHVVWLGGSHARADAHPLSDVDLGAIAGAGAGPSYRLSRVEEHVVSVSWVTEVSTRDSLANPALVGAAVPGWRSAELLHDPDGLGAELVDLARAWKWQDIEAACDRWAAEQVTGYTEEVYKVVAAERTGHTERVAVQRSVLALRLALVMSVHRRLLYDSENKLWELVSTEMGDPWASLQVPALCGSVTAALGLFEIAAAQVAGLLDDRQAAVVGSALALIAGRTP